MADGKLTRENTGNPLDTGALGQAPLARPALSGIRSGQGSVKEDTFEQGVANSLLQGSAKMQASREVKDQLKGRMSAIAGETEQELRDRGGSRNEMAGLVGHKVGNMLSAWHHEQIEDAAKNWSDVAPESYQEHLSSKSAELIEKVGSDPVAMKALGSAMDSAVSKLAASQRIAHQQYVDDGIASTYAEGLTLAAGNERSTIAYATPGATQNAGFQTFAQGVLNTIIGVESAGDPNAKNSESSAEGLGQFIDSTWLETIQTFRPDLANSLPTSKILALKTDPKLSREMTLQFTAQNAAILANKGLAVTPANAYLMHFAGRGSGPRVITGDRSAHVSSVLKADQIAANGFLKNWTVGQLQDWAARKMSGAGSTPLRDQVLTNPGLEPKRHRAEVLGAMVDGLRSNDASLYEGAGGSATLRELGASAAEIRAVQREYDAMKKRELTAYSMEYERGVDDIIERTASGELTEEQAFEELDAYQKAHPRTDVEAKRVYEEVKGALEESQRGQGWATPEGIVTILNAREAAQAADTPEALESVLQSVVQEGVAMGISPDDTAKQLNSLATAYTKASDKRKAEVTKKAAAAEKTRVVTEKAQNALSTKTLSEQPKDVQAAGLKLLQSNVAKNVQEEVQRGDLHVSKAESEATRRYVGQLVRNNAVDTQLASEMAAAVVDTRGWSQDGEIPDEAIVAYATYLEFVKGEQATEGFMNRMFKDKPEALALFRTAESLDMGSSDTEASLRIAGRMAAEPARAEQIRKNMSALEDGGVMEQALDLALDQAGLSGNWFQRRLGTSTLSPHLSEDRESMKEDVNLRNAIESVTRTQLAVTPGITPEAAAKFAAGEVLERGVPILGSYVQAPSGTTMYEIAGIPQAEGPLAINEAVQMGIQQAFKDQLPKSAQDSMLFALRGKQTHARKRGMTPAGVLFGPEIVDAVPTPEELTSAGWSIHYTPIEGDVVMEITPNEATIDNWSKVFLGSGDELDVQALGTPMIISLKEAGDAWNSRENETSTVDDAVNSLVDWLRPDSTEPTPSELEAERAAGKAERDEEMRKLEESAFKLRLSLAEE